MVSNGIDDISMLNHLIRKTKRAMCAVKLKSGQQNSRIHLANQFQNSVFLLHQVWTGTSCCQSGVLAHLLKTPIRGLELVNAWVLRENHQHFYSNVCELTRQLWFPGWEHLCFSTLMREWRTGRSLVCKEYFKTLLSLLK